MKTLKENFKQRLTDYCNQNLNEFYDLIGFTNIEHFITIKNGELKYSFSGEFFVGNKNSLSSRYFNMKEHNENKITKLFSYDDNFDNLFLNMDLCRWTEDEIQELPVICDGNIDTMISPSFDLQKLAQYIARIMSFYLDKHFDFSNFLSSNEL